MVGLYPVNEQDSCHSLRCGQSIMDIATVEPDSARKRLSGSKFRIAISRSYGFSGIFDKFSEWNVGTDRYELSAD